MPMNAPIVDALRKIPASNGGALEDFDEIRLKRYMDNRTTVVAKNVVQISEPWKWLY